MNMIKSRFTEKQQPVTVIVKDKVYVYICLNETEITEENIYMDAESSDSSYSSTPMIMYEYDYNEIIEDIGILDLDDVNNNPEIYLDYKREKEKTTSQRLKELENMNAELSVTLDSILTDVLPTLMFGEDNDIE